MNKRSIGYWLATGLLAADFGFAGAAISHVAAGDAATAAVPPLIVLALWFASWRLRPASRRLLITADAGSAPGAAPALHAGSLNASARAATSVLLAGVCGLCAACSPSASDSRPEVRPSPGAPATASSAEAAAVVDFWREAGPKLWFAKDPAFDRRFRERFIALHEAAARGELDAWNGTPEGSLALLILLDQFPRNAFRGTPRMYATDAQARALADRAIRSGLDRAVEPELRVFMYLPFGHSENLADQERAVRLCESLGEPTLSHAKHHRDIVRRFGRFPHRNPILGRAMRPEEQQYLDEGGYTG
jgi:uncharacterized protein (DUF924 family)